MYTFYRFSFSLINIKLINFASFASYPPPLESWLALQQLGMICVYTTCKFDWLTYSKVCDWLYRPGVWMAVNASASHNAHTAQNKQ